jgi:NAD/NADP transhydrogenase beta subunit
MSAYCDGLKLSHVLSVILSGLCVDVSRPGSRVTLTVIVTVTVNELHLIAAISHASLGVIICLLCSCVRLPVAALPLFHLTSEILKALFKSSLKLK